MVLKPAHGVEGLVGLSRATILSRCFLRSGCGCLRLDCGSRDVPLFLQLGRGWRRVAGGLAVLGGVPFRGDRPRLLRGGPRRRRPPPPRPRPGECPAPPLWAPAL